MEELAQSSQSGQIGLRWHLEPNLTSPDHSITANYFKKSKKKEKDVQGKIRGTNTSREIVVESVNLKKWVVNYPSAPNPVKQPIHRPSI